MIEQLYPCDHCGGRPTVGRSQRLVEQDGAPAFDFSPFGRNAGPPKLGDVLPRPLSAPKTEKLVCIYCSVCGISTPWESVGEDGQNELAAKNRCAAIWNQRLNRPKVNPGDLRDLIEKELGACDAQLVLNLLARNDMDWAERGPIFAMLAQRIVDATAVTFETWPISPVLEDAARYRKLMQLAKWVEIDGERYAQFPKVPAPAEHADFLFEDRVAMAVDAMPDRDRW
ncbi:Lar family restriction alleviation protein [Paraburkholderia sp. BL10I2N1]|uniref:Lar family restriction alleviation protein n=1 Tax=Paraburkholderia sp. BL10I2N1 TaxID=1938796 RepID=UPI00105EF6A8|nr:Lar family restriction alleviation protein [Paraburkholderia sp. BL10I2N1]TDN59067.1 restriction alleviation protein Lar [Paraburkholderia sp. BL10I2N1]